MPSQFAAVCFEANDPIRLALFWAEILDREPVGGVYLPAGDGPGIDLRFEATDRRKVGQNRLHLDLTSASGDHQREIVGRALAFGAARVDVGQRADEKHVVLADPEGNEFCIIEPDNAFLAGCGLIGAVACDGSQRVGYFWSEVLAGRWSGIRTRRPPSNLPAVARN